MATDLEWTKKHPVSKVIWVPADKVYANDYNPNKVAPPEMELLKLSIESDGYTQPIVVWKTTKGYEVVDGFHRHLVGKTLGYTHLPVVVVNEDRVDKGNRMASTVRHNRARGRHQIMGMSNIVMDLTRRNWKDDKITRELGMDKDELLRLRQVGGLAELYADSEYSEAWEADDESA